MRTKAFFTGSFYEKRSDLIIQTAIRKFFTEKLPDYNKLFKNIITIGETGEHKNKQDKIENPTLLAKYQFTDGFDPEFNGPEEYDRTFSKGTFKNNNNFKSIFEDYDYNLIIGSIDKRLNVDVAIKINTDSVSDSKKIYSLIHTYINQKMWERRIFLTEDILPYDMSVYLTGILTHGKVLEKDLSDNDTFSLYKEVHERLKKSNWSFLPIDQNNKLESFRVISKQENVISSLIEEKPTIEFVKNNKSLTYSKNSLTMQLQLDIPFIYIVDSPKRTNSYDTEDLLKFIRKDESVTKTIVDRIYYSTFKTHRKALDIVFVKNNLDKKDWLEYILEEDISIDVEGDSIDLFEWYPDLKNAYSISNLDPNLFKMYIFSNNRRLEYGANKDYTINENFVITFLKRENPIIANISIYILMNRYIKEKFGITDYISFVKNQTFWKHRGETIHILDIENVKEIYDKIKTSDKKDFIKVVIHDLEKNQPFSNKIYRVKDNIITLPKYTRDETGETGHPISVEILFDRRILNRNYISL